MNIIEIILIGIPGTIAVLGILHCIKSYISDRYYYNNGICRECGEPLKCVDGWIHGSTYKCKNGHVYEFETI